jgi:hypothetical protein
VQDDSGGSSKHSDTEQVDTINQDHSSNEKHHHDQNGDLPGMQSLTVEELYDKEKFDLSTMEPGDVFALLQ